MVLKGIVSVGRQLRNLHWEVINMPHLYWGALEVSLEKKAYKVRWFWTDYTKVTLSCKSGATEYDKIAVIVNGMMETWVPHEQKFSHQPERVWTAQEKDLLNHFMETGR